MPEWADPVEQMVAIFSKEGLKQASFDRGLQMVGGKRELALRLHEAGVTVASMMVGRS